MTEELSNSNFVSSDRNREERREVRIVLDDEELAQAGAEFFVGCALSAVAKHGIFSVMLSGGNTPKKMYKRLASPEFRERVPWKATHIFWIDERVVPLDHPESNFRMAWESFLQFVPIPSKQVHRVRTELGQVEKMSEDYERQILDFAMKTEVGTSGPRFDLILLGMGEDGHIASLFPDIWPSNGSDRWVFSTWVPHLNANRISISFEVVNSARQILFLVSGDKKASMLKRVLEGEFDPVHYPAQGVRPRAGNVLWIVDRGAASQLK